jgi:osmoprotectant transport system substrate-binding protein
MSWRRTVGVSLLCVVLLGFGGCGRSKNKVVIGSKFFTEQVVLAELLAQEIEAKTGVPVERKTNLGGTLLVHKALLAGDIDLYVEYTGTALTAVLHEAPGGDPKSIYERVRKEYGEKFGLEVEKPLGFENTFAMVIRGDDAKNLGLRTISDLQRVAGKWRAGVGYEFQERPDGYKGLCARYGLRFGQEPRVMDLGLIYRALAEKQVDVVAGNSTDGVIDALGLVALEDDKHYFPPYDAVPVVRKDSLTRVPGLQAALDDLSGKISADDMRKMNYAVDGQNRDVRSVVSEFRKARGL